MVDNASIFALLRRNLVRRGFGRVVTLNYSPLTMDVRTAARRLAEAVEDVVATTGYHRIHLVGHSLGGLVARYYVQRLGGDARVHTLVTLGTPHTGTVPAYFLPVRLGRQLRPGSDLMAELAGPAPGCRTRFLAFWSDLDQMMIPKTAARLEHPDLSRAQRAGPRRGPPVVRDRPAGGPRDRRRAGPAGPGGPHRGHRAWPCSATAAAERLVGACRPGRGHHGSVIVGAALPLAPR